MGSKKETAPSLKSLDEEGLEQQAVWVSDLSKGDPRESKNQKNMSPRAQSDISRKGATDQRDWNTMCYKAQNADFEWDMSNPVPATYWLCDELRISGPCFLIPEQEDHTCAMGCKSERLYSKCLAQVPLLGPQKVLSEL